MVVAVHTKNLIIHNLWSKAGFLQQVFVLLARQYPQHQFYFIFPQPYIPPFTLPQNVQLLPAGRANKKTFLWKWWYDVTLPGLLKKIGAHVFVTDGYCSLTTKVPQCLVQHHLLFLHDAQAYNKMDYRFYKWYTRAFLKKAAVIMAVSGFVKNEVIAQYKVPDSKINVVYSNVAHIPDRPDYAKLYKLKEKYTEGREYFVYAGSIHPGNNIINLLKAFSAFKKRQKSGMKLVLCGPLDWQNDLFVNLLQTYKYRADVVVLQDVTDNAEIANIVAGAYALVHPLFYEGFSLQVLAALRCSVPVVTSINSSMQELAGDAALYFDPHNVADMAAWMMEVYKNENLRSAMIEKGKAAAQKYSWQNTADAVWESIGSAIKA